MKTAEYNSDHTGEAMATTWKMSSSLLQQSDRFFSDRVLSRQSTVGRHSSRIYYRGAEGIPFQWEEEPGKPINPPQENPLPPLSPPPAILSMGMAKPALETGKHHHHRESNHTTRTRHHYYSVWTKVPSTASMWKKIVKKREKLIEMSESMMERIRRKHRGRTNSGDAISSGRRSVSGPAEYVPPPRSTPDVEKEVHDNGYFWRFDGETMRVMPRNSDSVSNVSSTATTINTTTTTNTTTLSKSSSASSLSMSSSRAADPNLPRATAGTSKYGDDDDDYTNFTCIPLQFRSPIVFRVVNQRV